MAAASSSSSRDPMGRNRASMNSTYSLHASEGNQVVVTSVLNKQASRPNKIINGYELVHNVGRGQHGQVWLAKDRRNGNQEVAVKVVKRHNPKADRMKQLRRRPLPESSHTRVTEQLNSTEHKIRKEIAIMKKLSHPHVVRLIEVIDDKLSEKIYMVMEYLAGGEVIWRKAGTNVPTLRVEQTRRICRDVILGLEYLHYQGIIHRDIKPANLLWTADRRTVKITDFGVSTFSYAQRLAAAGKGRIGLDDNDPILLDESDLSKTAGTPMFLAPEIVTDTPTNDASSSTLHLSRKKPPITKAIDIWALGVTLYALLFGTLPFEAKLEYEIYRVIRDEDWDVPDSMGSDAIPVGGRRQRAPHKGQETEGYLVVQLLQRLLDKDARKRITLEEIKVHPWILRDMSGAEDWLRNTQLNEYKSLDASVDETSSAMSSVRFKWFPAVSAQRLTKGISSVFHRIRSQRSMGMRKTTGRSARDPTDDVGVQSAPHISHGSHRSRHKHAQSTQPEPRPYHGSVREKGKRRQSSRTELNRNKSANDIHARAQHASHGHPKPFEPWPPNGRSASSAATSGAPSASGSGLSTPLTKTHGKRSAMSLQVPPKQSLHITPGTSPLPTPSTLDSPSGLGSPDGERVRGGLLSRVATKLGMRRYSYLGTSSPDTGSSSSTTPLHSASAATLQTFTYRHHHPMPATSPPSRDSVDEVQSAYQFGSRKASGGSGAFTAAVRAASWTQGEFALLRPSEDMTSLYSADRPEDPLDEDTLLLGAGGVAHSPVPSIPNTAGLSTVSSIADMPPPTPQLTATYALLLARAADGGDPPDAAGSANNNHAHHPTAPRTTSPLAHGTYPPTIVGLEDEDDDDDRSAVTYDSDDDTSSVGGPVRHVPGFDTEQDQDQDLSTEGTHSLDLQPSTSQMYREEDEETDEEEEMRLEVRTRRASAGAHSPPHGAHAFARSPERQMICA